MLSESDSSVSAAPLTTAYYLFFILLLFTVASLLGQTQGGAIEEYFHLVTRQEQPLTLSVTQIQ